MKHLPIAALIGALAAPVAAEEFTFAVTTDPQTLDPHAVNSPPVLGVLNNVYEGLVRRGKDMSIEPALATSWKPIGDGAGWRFKLREDVSFHDGAAFNADDVVKVDDYTVDIMTASPNVEKKLGSWNFGGYSNARVDMLSPMIQPEIDDTKRQGMLDEVVKILQDKVAYVPLYVQPLVWGARSNIELTQRPDNFFLLRWVTVK